MFVVIFWNYVGEGYIDGLEYYFTSWPLCDKGLDFSPAMEATHFLLRFF